MTFTKHISDFKRADFHAMADALGREQNFKGATNIRDLKNIGSERALLAVYGIGPATVRKFKEMGVKFEKDATPAGTSETEEDALLLSPSGDGKADGVSPTVLSPRERAAREPLDRYGLG